MYILGGGGEGLLNRPDNPRQNYLCVLVHQKCYPRTWQYAKQIRSQTLVKPRWALARPDLRYRIARAPIHQVRVVGLQSGPQHLVRVGDAAGEDLGQAGSHEEVEIAEIAFRV